MPSIMTRSPYCGSCKFRERSLLEKLSLETRGYEIVQYLYGTADISLPKFFKKSSDTEKWSQDSNWVGFVAVCTSSEEIARLGRRDIVVAWRGTVTGLEWIEDTETWLCPTGVDTRWVDKASPNYKKHVDLKVEKGFLSLYRSSNERSRYNKTSASEQVLCAVTNLVEKYNGEHAPLSITITGHSLGGALATLCAYDIAESGINKLSSTYPLSRIETLKPHEAQCLQSRVDIPITVYTFAAPRVGNTAFCERLEELKVKVLRVVNLHDLVPHVPGLVFNERFKFMHPYIPKLKHFIPFKLFEDFVDMLPASYSHVGVELQLDNTLSRFLKKTWNPINPHNLEAYLHLLAGFQGRMVNGIPHLAVRRDVSLVNKWSDFLESEFQIPCFWWQEKNKGMRGRDPEDIPIVPPEDQ